MRSVQRPRQFALAKLLVVALTVSLGVVAVVPASALPSVRGFDGKTVTVAGLGVLSRFTGVDVGAEARVKRFNDTNEGKGIKIKFAEFADDKGDPATATAETRRLVTQVGVFAVVPNVSFTYPIDYLTQQKVPTVGGGFDNSFCSDKPTTKLWAFGIIGCAIPSAPKVVADIYNVDYPYVAKKTGNKHPTIAIISTADAAGKTTVTSRASAAQGIGFDVVYAKGVLPPSAGDYSPYSQALLTSANGKAPDEIACTATTQCISLWSLLKASGYTGTYVTGLYSPLVVKLLDGTMASTFYNTDPTTGQAQMQKDLDKIKPGTATDIGSIEGYFSMDMFIQALKKVGKNITPDAVQKALSTISWQIKGFMGPTKYPASTVARVSQCSTLSSSNGTSWTTAIPYTCSNKVYKMNPKFSGT